MGDLALAAGRPVFDAIDAELLGRMSPGALILHDNWSMQDEASPARQRSCAPAVQLRVGPLQDVSFTRDKFSELKLKNLRLWWPQGYGQQPLYRLAVVASSGGAPSYRAEIYFGVRKLGYFCRPAEYAHTLVPIPDGAWPYDYPALLPQPAPSLKPGIRVARAEPRPAQIKDLSDQVSETTRVTTGLDLQHRIAIGLDGSGANTGVTGKLNTMFACIVEGLKRS